LYSLSEHELRSELPVAVYSGVKNISVDDIKVVVEEFAVNRGEILYRAVVDVDYHFDARETD
jgi:helix-turn-helix protein